MIKKLIIYGPALILIGLAIYFIFTTSPGVRYWVDDFCAAAQLRRLGYFGSQAAWWRNWTGRYSFIALLDLFEKLGPLSARITPVFIFLFLIAALTPVVGILMGSVFTILTLINAPNIIQSFYWQMGSINYMVSFVFFALILSSVYLARKKRLELVALILAFIGGGFSEVYAVSQITFLLFMFVFLKFSGLKNQERRIRVILFAVLGAIFSVGVMSLSPGNSIRSTANGGITNLLLLSRSTLLGTKWYLLRMLSVKPFIYSLILVMVSAYLFNRKIVIPKKSSILLMVFSLLAGTFTVMAAIFVGFYATGIILPERALFIPVYFMLLSFLSFSFGLKFFLGRVCTRKTNKIIWWGVIVTNIIFTGLLMVPVTRHWKQIRNEIKDYAIAIDTTEPLLLNSSDRGEISIKNIKPVGELDSFTDNGGWVTSCLSNYYNIDKINITP